MGNIIPQSETGAVPQTDAKWARRALILLVLLNVFNYLDRQILAAVVPALRTEFFAQGAPVDSGILGWLSKLHGGGSPENAALGTLAVAFMLVYMVFAPLVIMLPIRRWWLIGTSVIIWSLASGGSGLATTFGLLLLTRCLVGFGEAGYGAVAPAMISTLYPGNQRGRMMSYFYLAVPVGCALGFVFGGGLAALSSWRLPFYLVTIPGLLLGVACFFMPDIKLEGDKKGTSWKAYGTLLGIPTYRLAVAGGTLMTFAIGGMAFWMPSYVCEYRGAGTLASVNAMFGAILVISGIAGTLTGGVVADWLHKRGYAGAYLIVPTVALMLACPFWLLMMFTPFPLAWVFATLASICLFTATAPINTVLANVAPAHMRTAAFALNIFVIHALGDVISPVIIGSIADAWNMQVAFLSVSATVGLGAVLWLIGWRYVARDTQRAAEMS